MNTAKVQIRDVYGTSKVYPENQTARIFARIAGTKTLTKDTLAEMLALGVTIDIVGPDGMPQGYSITETTLPRVAA